MGTPGNRIRARLLAGGVFFVLLVLTSITAAAETWRAERQAQLLGTSILDQGQVADLLTGAYADQIFERCMNELYRACVAEGDPLYTLTMAAWTLGYERQKQLLGAPSEGSIDLGRELDRASRSAVDLVPGAHPRRAVGHGTGSLAVARQRHL